MSWIEHVKSVAKKDKISYKEALKKAGATYKKKDTKTKDKVIKKEKPKKK